MKKWAILVLIIPSINFAATRAEYAGDHMAKVYDVASKQVQAQILLMENEKFHEKIFSRDELLKYTHSSAKQSVTRYLLYKAFEANSIGIMETQKDFTKIFKKEKILPLHYRMTCMNPWSPVALLALVTFEPISDDAVNELDSVFDLYAQIYGPLLETMRDKGAKDLRDTNHNSTARDGFFKINNKKCFDKRHTDIISLFPHIWASVRGGDVFSGQYHHDAGKRENLEALSIVQLKYLDKAFKFMDDYDWFYMTLTSRRERTSSVVETVLNEKLEDAKINLDGLFNTTPKTESAKPENNELKLDALQL